MREHDIIPRIKALCAAREWTFYRLAKESGIPYSTLCTMLHKACAPSIPTLVKICDGFGITLAEFFDEGCPNAELSSGQRQLLRQWDSLSPEQRRHLSQYMTFLSLHET